MNATEMRDYHIENVYKPLVTGTMKPNQAKEANNAMGKVIGSAKAQLEAVAMSKVRPDDVREAVPFLK